MNVKLKVLSAGAVFFLGMGLNAQTDTARVQDIDEVVVIGYGTQKRSEVTASVASVKGSDLSNLNTPTFEAQLAGRASGVQVIQNTGLIGSPPSINIRGINSISSGTQPLYVVDGMPIFSGSTGGGYTPSNALGDINPNDIESVEILKDGAATAIYGSRGANGVVLITTKKGKSGRFTVSYNNLTTYATVAKYFDLLNTQEFLEIMADKGKPWGDPPNYNAEGAEFDTDWQKAVMRTGTQTDNNVSFSGGMGTGKYLVSLGHTWQEGIIKSNSMQRWTAKFSADQKIINNKVTVGGDFNLARTGYEGLNNGENSLSGAMYNALKQHPNVPVYDKNNPTGYNIETVGTRSYVGRWTNNNAITNFLPNIVMVLDTNKNTSTITRIIGNVFATSDITSWMNYRFQASVDNANTQGLMFWNRVHGDGFGRGGIIEQSSQDLLRWNIQNILGLKKTFGDAHNFNLTLINEYQKEDNKIFWGGGTGLSDDFFGSNVISGSYTTQTSGGGRSDSGFLSYAGRLNYNFANKYFLQGSLRYDGLSNLPKDKRWGLFPGVSAGWTVSNENFLSDSETISDLKFRASWAKVGNTNIGAYPYLGLYSNARYADNTGIGFSQAGNPDLEWETSTKTDIGMDLGLFGNRVKIVADYYKNDIDNLILARLYPPMAGIPGSGTISENVGRVVNDGFEFSVDADIVKKSNFQWSSGFNITTVNNEVKALVDDSDMFNGVYRINRIGEALNSLWGYKYYGVNMANGYPVYYKQDGSLVQRVVTNGVMRVYDPNNPGDISKAATLTEADKFIIGRTQPKFFGAWNNNFRMGSFDLSALVRFNYGNDIMNLTRRDMLNQDFVNNSREILGRWQSPDKPGDGVTPMVMEARNPQINDDGVGSSRFVEDGSFIKIDNLTLGYTFDKSLISSAYLSNLRIFVQAQNAFIFTKYTGADPELTIGGLDWNTIPRQRSFSVGLNATF